MIFNDRELERVIRQAQAKNDLLAEHLALDVQEARCQRDKYIERIAELEAFVEACADCATGSELEDFVFNNVDKVTSGNLTFKP